MTAYPATEVELERSRTEEASCMSHHERGPNSRRLRRRLGPCTQAASLDGESLTIRIRTARGERVQTLTPTDSGLRMVNTYTVEQLSGPMRIELVYRRDGA